MAGARGGASLGAGVEVMGHRGAGGNEKSRAAAGRMIRENTPASFAVAAAAGADGLELDVQLTADGVPVIWHDDKVYWRERGGGEGAPFECSDVGDFTLAEWRARVGGDAASGRPAAQLGRPFRNVDGTKTIQQWDALVEGHLPTLEEALASVPASADMLWNLELKFAEARSDALRETPEGRAEWEAVVRRAAERTHAAVVEAGARAFYSSFDPDACRALRDVVRGAAGAADVAPVLMLTDASFCPAGGHADRRRSSLAAAVAFVEEHALDGMVCEVKALRQDPAFCAWGGPARGRWLMTFGDLNADAEVIGWQLAAGGICGICTDDVVCARNACQRWRESEAKAAAAMLPQPRDEA
eukprot:PRCOL_00000892-RA